MTETVVTAQSLGATVQRLESAMVVLDTLVLNHLITWNHIA